MSPLVTVVVPAFNQAHTVGLCVRSALDQAYPHTEVIVVDDASDDDTASVAAASGATVLRLPENQGPSAARNLGAERARGDVLFFLDADVALAQEGEMTGLHTAICAIRAEVFAQVGPFRPELRHTEAPEYGERLRSNDYEVRSTGAIAGVKDHDPSLRVLLPKVLRGAVRLAPAAGFRPPHLTPCHTWLLRGSHP